MKPKIIGSQNHIHQYDLREFTGRIFFVTDLHGHYDLFHEKLKEVGFDSNKDVVFCGGDWCDRGPDSQHVLDYIYEPWIHSVRANHEELFISAKEENWTGPATNCLVSNGGTWVAFLEDAQMDTIYQAFKSLPLSIEILLPNNIKVGIIHADCPYNDWDQWTNITTAEFNWNGAATAQWSRRNIDRGVSVDVKGVDFLLTGHSPTKSGEIEKLGNQIYCDLGSFFRNKIAMIEINEDFISWVKND